MANNCALGFAKVTKRIRLYFKWKWLMGPIFGKTKDWAHMMVKQRVFSGAILFNFQFNFNTLN